MNSPGFDSGDLDGNGTPSSQSRKRKAAGGGSSGRGVASLTPEQLAKKRANDREAQRAIRERTKNTIEHLERKIHELTSQQPYQELQSIIRQKDAVQAENEDIRRRLASVVTILQPLVGAQTLQTLQGENGRSLLAGIAQVAHHNVQAALGSNDSSTDTHGYQEQYINGGPPRSVPPHNGSMPPIISEQQHYPSPYPVSDQDHNNDTQPWHNQRTALNNQRENMQRSHELSENGERLNFSFLIDSNQQAKNNYTATTSERRNSPHGSSTFASFSHTNNETGTWTMLPKNCPATCPLDSILLNFLKARQHENATYPAGSSPAPPVYSPAYPSISNLLNPANTATLEGTSSPGVSRHFHKAASPCTQRASRPDPLSSLMTDIISTFPNISGLPEQVATTFIMFLHMRWQIFPTQENYDCLPDWLAPRPSQLFHAHPAWMDHLPWPRMRDRVVHKHTDYSFEQWFLPFTSGLSVNWPYEPVDCLIATSENEEPVINPVFVRHIRRLDNWTVGSQFAATYPHLADTVIVRDHPGNGPVQGEELAWGGGGQVQQALTTLGSGTGLPMHQVPGGQQGQQGQQRQGGGQGGQGGINSGG